MLNNKYKIILGVLICAGLISLLIFCKITQRPNVILITIDALRPDHLGCYGYKRNTSPNIDTFAKSSTLYLNAFSQAGWTIPSNYSLLTSLYPSQHKMIFWGSIFNNKIPTLISVLHNNGYVIGIFSNHIGFIPHIKKNFGDLLNELKDYSNAPSVTKGALEWIKSQKRPFFLWVYYFNTHRPYNAPPPHDKLYSFQSDRHLPIMNVERHYIGGWDYIPQVMVENGIDNPDYYIAKYDGTIHYLDEEVGKLLKGLKEKDLFRGSMIILSSDHGESLGEHHLYFNHTFTLFNEIIKVPLIIKRARQTSPNIIQNNVAMIDILPTILKEIGIKVFNRIEGIPLFSKIPIEREILSYLDIRIIALISGQWKLIKYLEPMNKNSDSMKTSLDKDFSEVAEVDAKLVKLIRLLEILEYPAEKYKIFFPEYPAQDCQLFNIKKNPLELVNLSRTKNVIYSRMKLALSKYEYKMRLFKNESRYFELDSTYKKLIKSLGYLQ